MKMSQRFRQTVVCGLVCLVLTTGMALGQDKALKVLPDNSLLCIKLNGLGTTLTQLDNYLMGVSPFLPGMLVKGQLGAMLGNPALAGLDQEGSVVLFMVPAADPSGMMPVMPGLLVPVTDYDAFITGSQACNDMGNGMAMMSLEDLPPLQIVSVGDYALMAPAGVVDMDTLKQQLRLQGGATLGQTLSKAAGKEASGNSLWVYANLKQVNAMFGPMIQMGALSVKQELQGMAGQPGMAQALSMIDSLLALLDQVDTATVSLNVQPTSLNLTSSFSAVSGSALAQALDNKPDKAALNRMIGQMDSTAMMSLAGSWEGAKLAQAMELVMGDLGRPIWEKYKSVGTVHVVETINVAQEEANSQPTMAVSVLAEIDNPQPMVEMFSNPNALLESLGLDKMLEQEELGMSIEVTEPETLFSHQGVEVKGVTQKIAFDDANALDGEMAMAAAMGTETTSRWAVMGKTLVSATGPNGETQIKALIDKAKQGITGGPSDEYKTLMGYLSQSDDLDMVGTYNYIKIIDLIAAAVPIPMPMMEIPVKTPLVFSAKCRKGTAYGELAVPKQHAQEMMQFVQMMMMMQMQQQMQQQP